MIARVFIPILLAILLADLFIDLHYIRRASHWRWLKRLIWWFPGAVMAVFTIYMAMLPDFAPAETGILNTYLFLLGFLVVPKFEYAFCSVAGWLVRKLSGFRIRRNYGHYVGAAFVLLTWYILIYGTTIGFSKLDVRQMEYCSEDLPVEFDGYRIVHFSDAHVGTYTGGKRHLLEKAIDSINSQKADMIVFTGDLQNMRPSEIRAVAPILSKLRAKDGVVSILGNHDYPVYVDADDKTKAAYERETRDIERQMGWKLLLNEHLAVRRGNDSIVIAGMENDGESMLAPKLGDVKKTLSRLTDEPFTVMLEHDPTCWRRKILPQSKAQLTLSGHTHAMQFELFGWSPASLIYKEWGGVFYEGERAINVSTGLGGFMPFRFGVPGEIVVITLRIKKKAEPPYPTETAIKQSETTKKGL